jgi:hypothetical protein
MKQFFTIALSILGTIPLLAQCPDGQVEFSMNILTDGWGEECYWELVPDQSPCGTGTLVWGGNENVGCAGNDPGGADLEYLDNTIYYVNSICLADGAAFDLIYIDSYGDGGIRFEVFQEGVLTALYMGQNEGNTWSFVAGEVNLPENDSPCNAIPLSLDAAPIDCNNETAIAGLTEPSPVGGPCGLSGAWCESDENVTNSLWYSFVAEGDVSYEITTCNDAESFDTQLALYAVGDCDDYSTYTLISSNDDMIGGCGLTNGFASTMYASCLEEGMTYYIQLDGWEGDVGNTTLAIFTYAGASEIQPFVHSVNCPLSKGDEPNGAIELHIVGETTDFTAIWSGPNNFSSTSNWIEDLDPGDYEVTVTSACGNVFTGSYTITQPDYWDVTITTTAPDCDASGNGSLAITTNGATSPFSYNWTGPDNFIAEGDVLYNLSAGSYAYFITDDNDCEYQGQVLLVSTNSFEFDLGAAAVLCLNETEVVSGPLECTYEWQDGSNNQFFVIDAASYGVSNDNVVLLTATNSLGCSYTDAFFFDIDDCIGVNEVSNSSFQLYPNPTNGYATLVFNQIDAGRNVNVYNVSGQLIYATSTANLQHLTLPGDWSPGLYFVEVTSGSQIERCRLMKQ